MVEDLRAACAEQGGLVYGMLRPTDPCRGFQTWDTQGDHVGSM